MTSFIAGRNRRPLEEADVRRVTNTFLGLDPNVPTQHEPGSPTVFYVAEDERGEEYGLIRFGEDIYPGDDVVQPNATLSMKAAAAHELTHYYRWQDMLELSEQPLWHIDEALTSLQAITRYGRQLNDPEIRQLADDAIQRLQLFVRQWRASNRAGDGALMAE